MDFVHAFLNIVVPPVAFCILLLLWPALSLRSTFLRFLKTLFQENVREKVVIITGATSSLGEALAYEYAKRGAILVLVSYHEHMLRSLVDACKRKGAKDVRTVHADVRKEDDCRRFIEDTVGEYGKVDHLVNNASLAQGFLFEETANTSILKNVVDTEFWGYVYPTLHALPHLKKSKGKIVVNASVMSWLPFPRMSMGGASKAAIMNFFDTLRVELGNSIGGITIATPGWIQSEMTMGRFLTIGGNTEMQQDKRDQQVGPIPVAYADDCAKALIQGVLRGHRYVRYPYWYTTLLLYRIFAPEFLDFLLSLFYVRPVIGRKDKATLSKVIMEIPGVKFFMYPPNLRVAEEVAK